MKKLKRLLIAFLSVCAIAASFAFAACNDKNAETNGNNNISHVHKSEVVVFEPSTDVMTLSDDTSLKDYLDALKNNGEITFDGYVGSYGYFITSVDNIEAVTDADGHHGWSWAIYTDLVELDGVYYSSDYQTYSYGDKTLYYASVGVDGMPCIENYTYALVFEEWSY